jgi:Txe/YoeB family toxin of Txe-Axe toxin-antitoxin module
MSLATTLSLTLIGCQLYSQLQQEKILNVSSEPKTEKKWNQDEYEKFKEKQQALWKESNKNTLDEKINDLIDGIDDDPSDENDLLENLFIFNFMRELLGQPTAQSIGPKEKEWLLNTWYGYWKKEKQDGWKNYKNTLTEQVNDLIDDIDDDPSDEEDRRENLFIFNFMRELLGQPTVQSIGPKEKAWLLNTQYEFWKKEKQDDWKDYKETLPEQINDLVVDVNYHLYDKPSENGALSNKPIFAFNYLRELLHQPLVQSIGPKEKEWLNKTEYEHLKAEWTHNDQANLSEKINSLISWVNFYLPNKNFQRESLLSFNYLRELLNQPLVQSIGQSEKDWLKDFTYEYFKKEKQAGWKALNMTFPEQIDSLTKNIDSYLSDIKDIQNKILTTYNYLRELLKQPIAKTTDQIDNQWLQQLQQKQERSVVS